MQQQSQYSITWETWQNMKNRIEELEGELREAYANNAVALKLVENLRLDARIDDLDSLEKILSK